MNDKKWTLEELTDLVGEEQLNKLFIEHYLMLAGKETSDTALLDELTEE